MSYLSPIVDYFMKIILSNFCTSLTGMINPELGYFVVPRKGAFYAVRSKWGAPPDGHWRFIRTCAEMTLNGLYIAAPSTSYLNVV